MNKNKKDKNNNKKNQLKLLKTKTKLNKQTFKRAILIQCPVRRKPTKHTILIQHTLDHDPCAKKFPCLGLMVLAS
jgi:hypothetical protein